MSAFVESRSLEAEIADCCREIYWATDPEIAMAHWVRLRKLTARQADAAASQYMLETTGAQAGLHVAAGAGI